MSIIYAPQGRAGEYSPLALNIYKGCSHGCVYCYVPNIQKRDRAEFNASAEPRKNIIAEIEKEAKKLAYSTKQILLNFSHDPYDKYDEKNQYTREVLKILLKNKIPVSVLTKAGTKCLRDLDLFREFENHIQVGASLTLSNPDDSKKYEPNAALPDDRIEALKELKENYIITWASFEPVLDPAQSIEMIERAILYTDIFKLGKISNYSPLVKINWNDYLEKALSILRNYSKDIYVKKELRETAREVKLRPEEQNTELFSAKPWSNSSINREFSFD